MIKIILKYIKILFLLFNVFNFENIKDNNFLLFIFENVNNFLNGLKEFLKVCFYRIIYIIMFIYLYDLGVFFFCFEIVLNLSSGVKDVFYCIRIRFIC